ncbi:MAG: pantoate--beta-alanine ligase [Alphaproteobacteria bacterium]
MKTVRSPKELKPYSDSWRLKKLRVAFVPTMGALHDGHISLIKLALEHADKCVVSIFVNPTQFAPHEDFDAYPRTPEQDLEKLKQAGANLVYMPTEAAIYPGGTQSRVSTGPAAEGLESDFRPHFFGGVVNVVARLFDHVRPDLAVFGEKDFQQLMVIKDMVEAEHLPIEIIGAPIIRDEYGLALSSRNAYLSAPELEIARTLNRVLKEADSTKSAETALLEAGFDKVDYVAERWGRRLAAAWIGKTRLIDNRPYP